MQHEPWYSVPGVSPEVDARARPFVAIPISPITPLPAVALGSRPDRD